MKVKMVFCTGPLPSSTGNKVLQWDQCSANNSASHYSNQNIVLFGCMSSRELCQGSAPSIFFFFEISNLCDKEKDIVGSSPAAKGQNMANIHQDGHSIRNIQVVSSNRVHSTPLCEANKCRIFKPFFLFIT